MYFLRSLLLPCLAALEFITGLQSHLDPNMAVFVAGLLDGGILLRGFVLLVRSNQICFEKQKAHSNQATMSSISGNIAVAMYGIYRPDYIPQRWHIFIAYLITSWVSCCTVLFANRALPMINNIGLFFILSGVFITIIVCGIMPHTGSGYASSSFVWADWSNQTGYESNGFVFLAGMLNGAYAVGTPDCVSHLAEEIPHPKRNVPLAIAAQMVIGFLTAFFYMIAIFYAISNLDDILAAPYFPLARIYAQATSSNGGTIGLLFIIFVPIFCTCIGSYITSGRCLWTISRDGAVPFSGTFGVISQRFKNPFNATLACGIFSTVLGAIYVGSTTAFNAFVGSFVVLSSLSYLAAIMPFVFTRHFSRSSEAPGPCINGMIPGPFQMGNSIIGYSVNIVSCLYIVVFIVVYSFPYSLPITSVNMNYSSLIAGGMTICAAAWWLVKGISYVGPKALIHESELHPPPVAMSEAEME